jgi:phospholipid transport system substrate-binding protein
MRRTFFLGWTGLFCVLALGGQVRAAADPGQQVDALHAVLVQAMKHGGTVAERIAIVDDQVFALFDFETIARVSVGREWTKMQAIDQTRLVDLLRRLSVATYADRFDKFEGQRFERQGVQTSKTGSVVKTVIVRSNGERVPLHYYFRAGKIFNVVADGVSDLALRRSDYGSILKREGLAALFKHVEQNVAELE